MTTVAYDKYGHTLGHPYLLSSSGKDTFPYKRYWIVGWLQIGLGLCAIIIQIIHFDFFLGSEDNRAHSVVSPYAWTGIWTGLVFILVGAFGASITAARKNQRQCLRITVMVLAIINAAVSAPALMLLEIRALVFENFLPFGPCGSVCDRLLLVIGIVEFVVTIVAAALCCCCYYSTDSGNQIPIVCLEGAVPGHVVIANYGPTQVVPTNSILPLSPAQPANPAPS